MQGLFAYIYDQLLKNVQLRYLIYSCQVDTIQGVISKIFGKFAIYFIQGAVTHIVTAGRVAVCYGIQF